MLKLQAKHLNTRKSCHGIILVIIYEIKDTFDLATILKNIEELFARRALGVSNSATFPSSSTITREHTITVLSL